MVLLAFNDKILMWSYDIPHCFNKCDIIVNKNIYFAFPHIDDSNDCQSLGTRGPMKTRERF